MSQLGVVTWLALRELWVSFRLLVLLGAFIGAGAFVAFVPDAPAIVRERLALGLGGAVAVSAAVAAWSIGRERELGRAGWLVTRSVSRRTLLVGWFVALGLTTMLGLLLAAGLGWAAMASVARPPDPGAFGLVLLAIGCTTLAALGIGMLTGAILPYAAAIVVAVAMCAFIGAIVIVAPDLGRVLPGGAHLVLASLGAEPRPVTEAVRAAGVGLLAAAGMLLLARLAFEGADL